jgi:hypothetical protein
MFKEEHTIHKYDEMALELIDKNKFKLVKIKDIIDNPVNIQWTIRHVIEQNGVSLIYGQYGCGKSFVAFDMAYCVAAGRNWHSRKTIQSPVVVLAGEGHSGIGDRFNALHRHYGGAFPEQLYLSVISASLTDNTNAQWVMESVNEVCPHAGLVIIDTLNRNFGVGDENSTKDMTQFISNVDLIFRNTGKTVIIVHHSGKDDNKGARGSIVLPGSVEAEIKVSSVKDNVTVSFKKQKNGKLLDNMLFKFKEIDLHRLDDEGEKVMSLVLESDESTLGDKIEKVGRPNKRIPIFMAAFEQSLLDDPVIIMSKKGAYKENVCNIFGDMLGLRGKSVANAFREVLHDLINSDLFIEINSILVKNDEHGN